MHEIQQKHDDGPNSKITVPRLLQKVAPALVQEGTTLKVTAVDKSCLRFFQSVIPELNEQPLYM